MALRIRYGGKVYESKSAAARAMYSDGKTVTEVTKLIPNMGYAFAYGIAKRQGTNLTAANRKAERPVVTTGDEVTVRVAGGTVRVNTVTGKVTKTLSRK